ncbi:MAG: ABC transporter ATP-binding protein [Nitrospinota bacterium]
MATVDLAGLTKVFGGEVRAVDRLDLHIGHGELVCLLGPSGCGKTTTLRLVAGFIEPDEGEVRIDGRAIASPSFSVPPEKRNMSMIFQSYAIWPHKTVYQNVAYGLKFRDVTRAEAERKVRSMLGVVRMEELADRYPAELSGGQQQRVALARALVVEPSILLLDEPLSNLDANLREEMRFEIRRLHDEFKITSIYVTHDQAEAMVTSDRIVVMNQGRAEQVGTAQEIYDRPRTQFVAEFVGKTNSLRGVLRGRDQLEVAPGILLRTAGGERFREGQSVLASVRPHNVDLYPEGQGPSAADGWNVWSGRISRAHYFGESLDYLVELPGWPQPIRAIVPPDRRFRMGEAVRLAIDPAKCVLVSASEGQEA